MLRSYDVYKQASGAPCVTMLYAPSGGTADAIMGRVAASTGLVLGTDIRGFASDVELAGWLYDNSASTQTEAAVVFDPTDFDVTRGSVSYSIVSGIAGGSQRAFSAPP